MGEVFIKILNMSITGSWVILFVIFMRLLLKKSPKIFSYILWIAVLFRLICPFSFESILSLIPLNKTTLPNDTFYYLIAKTDINSTITNYSNDIKSYPIGEGVSSMENILFVISIVWVIGVIALLTYNTFLVLKLKRSLKSAKYLEDNIWENEKIDTPFVFGIIKPKIYIPKNLSENQKTYILKHEETHIKRFDHIIKPFAFFVLCIHWFNPLVWLSFILMSKDMEMSCDEAVLKDMGSSIKKEYSSSLLSLSIEGKKFNGAPLGFGEINVKARIKNVLGYKPPTFWVIIVLVAIVIVSGIALISNPKKSKEKILTEKFLKYKTDYVGSNWKVGNIIGLLEFPSIIKYDYFELHTTSEPYGVTVYFNTSVNNKSEFIDILPKLYEKNALIMFALIGNVEYINFNLSYAEGENYVMTYNRDNWNFSEDELNNIINANEEEMRIYSPYNYDSIINELKAYDKGYDSQEANKDGIFAIIHGDVISDIKILNDFLENTKKGKPSEITIVNYTMEGDPVFIKIIYDGEKYYGVSDYSRDRHMGNSQSYSKFEYKYLKKFDISNNKKGFFLLNDESLTLQEIQQKSLTGEASYLFSFTK